MMNYLDEFPAFDDCFSDLNQFILELVKTYEAGEMESWGDLEQKVRSYFTPARMGQMESLVPGWQTMASYSEGITLVHVMCVFLGLLMLPEFQNLSPEQKQLAKWIVLLHDIAKVHIRGKKDTMHAFRSGVQAAQALPRFGFPAAKEYEQLIESWSEYTAQAFITVDANIKPDNRKLPEIIKGIDQLYGETTPAALIVKTVLLHISLDVDPFYPTPAPLREQEIKRFITPSLLPLLKAMMLSDNEGWSLFEPETRQQQRTDTLKSFQRFEKIIFIYEP
jgi:hypothetical protein